MWIYWWKIYSNMKLIVLLSGGMDSVSLLYHCRREHEVVAALSFDYGAKHHARELPWAAHHAAKFGLPHEVITLNFMAKLFKSNLLQGGEAIPDGHYTAPSMKQTVVPFRNGIMLSIAAGWAESIGAEGIAIAAHAGDHAIYPDCRADFMESMGLAIERGTYEQVQIMRPFVNLTKSEIAQIGHQAGVDFGETWSCYKGASLHCGTCGTCVERREAFLLADLLDPTKYLR
jgi:7-cyano-7-deazaguanine synthase